MPLRCPVCKADNAAGPNCRRCKADLSLLFLLEEQRRSALSACVEALETNRPKEAADWAARANVLRADEESRRLVAAAALLCGDFHGAWRTYKEARPDG